MYNILIRLFNIPPLLRPPQNYNGVQLSYRMFYLTTVPITSEMGRTCSTYGDSRSAYRVLVGKPEGRRPLERPRIKWEDNIKMDLREVGWGMDWIDLAQARDRWQAVVNVVRTFRVL